MWAAVVPRVRPATRPRAYWSQCGAPNPANAGTRYTPSGSVTCEANASTSDDDLMMPSPSRSHCTTAPAMKMLPSSAYSVRLPMRHATVVRRLCFDTIGLVPVLDRKSTRLNSSHVSISYAVFCLKKKKKIEQKKFALSVWYSDL